MLYVLNNDVNKAVIVAEGWVRGFRRLINCGSTVVPEQNNDVENPGNPNPIPVPIPRNTVGLRNRDQGNNLHQATSVGFTSQRLYAVEDAVENVPNTSSIDHSESNQDSPEQVVKSSSNDREDLEVEADEIEIISLDDIIKSSAQNCPTNDIRAPIKNSWV